MRSLTTAQREALADPATQICTCWAITRTDTVSVYLTDFDQPVTVSGHVYQPNGSSERTAVELSSGLSADNLSVRGVMGSDLIVEADVQNGLYDFADVKIFLAFANQSIDPIPLVTGKFGECTIDNGAYTMELRSLTQALQTTVGETTSPTCRAVFGDARCQAPLSTWRANYTVGAVTSARQLTITGTLLSASFTNGFLEVITGPAAGLSMEVKAQSGYAIELALPLAILPAVGDQVRLTAGCDQSRDTCKNTFSNAINFQGEPDLPGLDSIANPEVA